MVSTTGNDAEVKVKVMGDIEDLKLKLRQARKQLNDAFKAGTGTVRKTNEVVKLQKELDILKQKLLNIKKLESGKGVIPGNFAKKFMPDINKEVQGLGTVVETSFAGGMRRAVKKAGSDLKAAPTLGLPQGYDRKFTDINNQLLQLTNLPVKPLTAAEVATRRLGAAFNVVRTNAKAALPMIQQQVKKSTPAFQGWALSIMFFGMALKQMFMDVWRSSSRVFNDVMHSTDKTVTGFDMLSGSLAYLGFVVGGALEPIAFWLVPIIDKISEWVTQNEEVTKTILVIVGVVGFLATIIGSAVLAIGGFVGAWAQISGALALAKVAFMGFAAGISTPILVALGIILAAIVVAIALWKTNFGGFKDFVQNIFKSTWEFIKGSVEDLKLILGGLWKIISGIFEGDFKKVLNGVKDVVWGVLRFLIRIVAWAVSSIWNLFITVIKMIAQAFVNQIKMMIDALIWLIELAEKVPGADEITGGLKGSLQKEKDSLKGITNALKSDFGLTSTNELLDLVGLSKFMGLEKEDASKQGDVYYVTNNVSIDHTITDEQFREVNKSFGVYS